MKIIKFYPLFTGVIMQISSTHLHMCTHRFTRIRKYVHKYLRIDTDAYTRIFT